MLSNPGHLKPRTSSLCVISKVVNPKRRWNIAETPDLEELMLVVRTSMPRHVRIWGSTLKGLLLWREAEGSGP